MSATDASVLPNVSASVRDSPLGGGGVGIHVSFASINQCSNFRLIGTYAYAFFSILQLTGTQTWNLKPLM